MMGGVGGKHEDENEEPSLGEEDDGISRRGGTWTSTHPHAFVMGMYEECVRSGGNVDAEPRRAYLLRRLEWVSSLSSPFGKRATTSASRATTTTSTSTLENASWHLDASDDLGVYEPELVIDDERDNSAAYYIPKYVYLDPDL
jgi:hypothetical protein